MTPMQIAAGERRAQFGRRSKEKESVSFVLSPQVVQRASPSLFVGSSGGRAAGFDLLVTKPVSEARLERLLADAP